MGRHRQGIARSLIAALALIACADFCPAATASARWGLDARPPSGAPVRRGEGEDLRDVAARNAPVIMRGAVIVVVVTLATMTLILVPLGWARHFVARQAAKSGGMGLPSPKKYYVKIGVLGVASEFRWDLPDIVIGGSRFDMRLSKKTEGAASSWDLQDGTRLEFALKEEVDAARARHAAEHAEKRAASQAWRKFERHVGDEESNPRAPSGPD